MVCPATKLAGKDMISTQEWTKEGLDTVLAIADRLKEMWACGHMPHILDRKTLFMMFYNSSLRTRNSFEVGMTQLGGHAQFLDSSNSYVPIDAIESAPGRERVKDTAQVLDRYGEGLAIRVFGKPVNMVYGAGNQMIRNFAKYCSIPVLDMDCDMYHPHQALCDLMTLREKFGPHNLKGKKFVMSWATAPSPWKPLAVAHSNIELMTRYDMDVTVAYPKEFPLDERILKNAKENAEECGRTFEIVHDMDEAFEGADVVYPKGWTSINYLPTLKDPTKKPDEEKIMSLLKKYEVEKSWTCNADRMKKTNNAYYMHCLPADVRDGWEVTPEVIDGPRSIVIDEAENRLHVQKGVLAAVLGGRV